MYHLLYEVTSFVLGVRSIYKNKLLYMSGKVIEEMISFLRNIRTTKDVVLYFPSQTTCEIKLYVVKVTWTK